MPRLCPWILAGLASHATAQDVDYSRDVRPILAGRCFVCHGPDAAQRKGGTEGSVGLRLDTVAGQRADLGGRRAVVPGDPDASELMLRVRADGTERMPPRAEGEGLTHAEIELLERWIAGGAAFSRHWSFVAPARRAVPEAGAAWARGPIDRFVARRLAREALRPSAEADRRTLLRRVSLDLTGLPPAPDEVERFVRDDSPGAYERVVDRLLASPAYGEHQARQWLDLARYADSAGYADDPKRTIWAYRDWVIRVWNANLPFDEFTVQQIAGDLLPDATDDELVATAFHRNTMTNSEGGTDDEEFRSVAVVDRVNTTMAVWMGTTIACAQCHDHKYDPLSQKEFFELYAFFNTTQDSDKRNERPVLKLYSEEQRARRARLGAELAAFQSVLRADTPELRAGQRAWERAFPRRPEWRNRTATVTAIRLPRGAGAEGLSITVVPRTRRDVRARFVRVTLQGEQKFLSLAEVRVLSGGENVALGGVARQVNTAFDGPARLAIDGNTDGRLTKKSTTHTKKTDEPWWEVDLGEPRRIDRVVVWNRTDRGVTRRLDRFRVELLDAGRRQAWSELVTRVPKPSVELSPGGAYSVAVAGTYRDADGQTVAILVRTADLDEAELRVTAGPKPITLERTADAAFASHRATPPRVLAILAGAKATGAQRKVLSEHYRSISPELKPARDRVAKLEKELQALRPRTTVPILREQPAGERRKTHVHVRGNFLVKGDEVQPGVPAVFHALPRDAKLDRLELARWLVSPDNPLTARVVVNRFWEALFGVGLVATSDDFGTRGELPSDPELLDWLATDFVASGWDVKKLLKRIVTSATYRQCSHAAPELLQRDPDNRLLARGPRRRLSAEMVRDQALAVSGLLSRKMYGPPVRPPRPNLGLKAAFGASTDWEDSAGEDRYRRGIYTFWQRSIPYPSMAAFDAPSREVCIVRREPTNTPLQALVTLNDPVYVEAAQAFARRIVAESGATAAERAAHGFRIATARPPAVRERERLIRLFEHAAARYRGGPAAAEKMATDPLGPVPEGTDAVTLAAWTVVANVLLNLDEVLVKR